MAVRGMAGAGEKGEGADYRGWTRARHIDGRCSQGKMGFEAVYGMTLIGK